MRIFKRVLTSGLSAAGVLGGLSTAAASTNTASWPTCIAGEDVMQRSDGVCLCTNPDITYSKETGCKTTTSSVGPTNNPLIQQPIQPQFNGPTKQPNGSSGNTYTAVGTNNAAGYNITNTNTATNSGSNG